MVRLIRKDDVERCSFHTTRLFLLETWLNWKQEGERERERERERGVWFASETIRLNDSFEMIRKRLWISIKMCISALTETQRLQLSHISYNYLHWFKF